MDIGALTLAAILTLTGGTAAAGLVTGLVFVIKQILPGLVDGREPLTSATITLLLVIAAIASAAQGGAAISLEFLFAGLIAWYSIVRLSMAIHDDVAGKPRSLRNQSPS